MKKLLIAALLSLPTLSYAEKTEKASGANEKSAVATEEVSTTELQGTIADITNYAPLPEVKVIVSSEKNNINKTVLTDKEGKFVLDELPVGSYQVRFERDGYEPLTRKSLVVQNNKKNSFGFFLFKD
jgi:hypothetical protein